MFSRLLTGTVMMQFPEKTEISIFTSVIHSLRCYTQSRSKGNS